MFVLVQHPVEQRADAEEDQRKTVEYFNHLKIQKACQFLSFTDMPFKELSINVGIDDQYYFSRMFSRLMGISPTEYRKRNQNISELKSKV